MNTYTTPISGTYVADAIHSSFGFAVKYMGGATYRGTMDTVSARLEAGPDGTALTGAAEVESISIRTPQPFRAHVLGEQFFDADRHPQVTFSSDNVVLDENGSATVEGQLTIKAISRPVTARGTWAPPVPDPTGKTRATLTLEATVSRREYGISWDVQMPDGRPALADDVTITVDLFLVAQSQE
jgi:polyisoprenoid-binding protein YceI